MTFDIAAGIRPASTGSTHRTGGQPMTDHAQEASDIAADCYGNWGQLFTLLREIRDRLPAAQAGPTREAMNCPTCHVNSLRLAVGESGICGVCDTKFGRLAGPQAAEGFPTPTGTYTADKMGIVGPSGDSVSGTVTIAAAGFGGQVTPTSDPYRLATEWPEAERRSVVVDPEKLTRVTIVGPGGIEYESYHLRVALQVQDDGRTLKVFVTRNRDAASGTPAPYRRETEAATRQRFAEMQAAGKALVEDALRERIAKALERHADNTPADDRSWYAALRQAARIAKATP